ncbi:hypothetical protein NB693_20525 [Pantoea ananatis]|uniref:hypothetical protein n=1 Tax=Pantoea ananas TaxID=553 RepID=UPI00222117E6|nr:hypothetical protein [Pantoea ananatis]
MWSKYGIQECLALGPPRARPAAGPGCRRAIGDQRRHVVALVEHRDDDGNWLMSRHRPGQHRAGSHVEQRGQAVAVGQVQGADVRLSCGS